MHVCMYVCMSGTQNFSLSHARDMLNISSFTRKHLRRNITDIEIERRFDDSMSSLSS